MTEINDADPWVWVCAGCDEQFTSGWDDELETAIDEPAATYPGNSGDPIHLCGECAPVAGDDWCATDFAEIVADIVEG
ncbi:hypothetical protein ACQP0C_41790 (plasmid) [Nocardia sp. CA-129566]|uniref:hypothetical protein n=1 Tax=Nocardia sp. CA-129566 TaxID=3239976 RepID=UPI003D9715D4